MPHAQKRLNIWFLSERLLSSGGDANRPSYFRLNYASEPTKEAMRLLSLPFLRFCVRCFFPGHPEKIGGYFYE